MSHKKLPEMKEEDKVEINYEKPVEMMGDYGKKQQYEEAKAEVYPTRSGSGQFRDRQTNSNTRFEVIGPTHE
jgi:hypothetical protein